MKSLTVDAKSCTVESVETCTDDANYEIYTFLCVLEEGQTSLTMEVTIPEEFSTNNAYFRSLSIESTEAPVVEETYPVTLNFLMNQIYQDITSHTVLPERMGN